MVKDGVVEPVQTRSSDGSLGTQTVDTDRRVGNVVSEGEMGKFGPERCYGSRPVEKYPSEGRDQ